MRIARVVAAFLLTLGLFWIAPPQLRLVEPSDFLGATLDEYLFDHQTINRAPAGEAPYISARVTTPKDTSEFEVIVHYRCGDEPSWQDVAMPRVVGSFDLHSTTLPVQPRGKYCFYHLELRDADDSLLARLPEDPVSEIRLSFVGEVPIWLRALRIGSIFLGTMFAWISLFNALSLRQPQLRLPRLANRVIVTTILLLLGGILAGAAVKYAARGYFWDGWPLGDNPEQSAWLLASAYWIGLTLMVLNNIFALRSGKRKIIAGVVTLAVVAGFVLVLIAYLTGV